MTSQQPYHPFFYHDICQTESSLPDMWGDKFAELSLPEMDMKICRGFNGDRSHGHGWRDVT